MFDAVLLDERNYAYSIVADAETDSIGGWGVKKHLGGRDLVKPWVEACRRNDIAVGFYFSPINWMWKTDDIPHRGFPRKNNWTRAREFVDWPKEKLQPVLDKCLQQDVFPCMEESPRNSISHFWSVAAIL